MLCQESDRRLKGDEPCFLSFEVLVCNLRIEKACFSSSVGPFPADLDIDGMRS